MDSYKKRWRFSILHDEVILKTFNQDPEPDLLYSYLKMIYPRENHTSHGHLTELENI